MPPSEGEKTFSFGEEKVLLRTRIGDVVSAEVTCLRRDRQAQFYRFNFSDWVNIIALTPDQQVVLVSQFRFGSNRYELEIPGGGIENGEDPLAAGLRELREETGFAGRNGRIIGKVCPNPALQGNSCYTVLVEDVKVVAAQQLDNMEDIEVRTVPFTEIDRLIRTGIIDHSLVLNAFMLYERQKKT